jgi:hypothetical protein
MYGVNIDSVFNKILYEIDSGEYPTIIITIRFITPLVHWYNNRLLPLIRQFFLIPN